jgi:hypothetical protein
LPVGNSISDEVTGGGGADAAAAHCSTTITKSVRLWRKTCSNNSSTLYSNQLTGSGTDFGGPGVQNLLQDTHTSFDIFSPILFQYLK